jgi:hypothetical protein
MVTASRHLSGQHRNVTYGELLHRVGGTNIVKQAGWLLDFAQKDLTASSDHDIAALCEALPVIGVWDSKELQRMASTPAPHIDWIAPYRPSGFTKKAGLSLQEAQKTERAMKDSGERRIIYEMFQEPVAKLFRGLLSPGKATTEEIGLRLEVRKGAHMPLSIPDPENPHKLFIYRAAFIVQAVADRLVPCADPKCHRGPHGRRQVFIQSRRDKEFCSEGCGSRVRMERRRVKKKKRATQKATRKNTPDTASTKGAKAHGTK